MTPTTTQLIVTALLTYGPEFARKIQAILAVADPTPEQWDTLFAEAEKSYHELVPHSNLPKE